ncbi:MAG: ABC transporter substrate-binding protein [candidate division Zixibacteria bacterium]|nr:ABC transporter substrate-binding protein [candidate division Zixibacteria bacterium]
MNKNRRFGTKDCLKSIMLFFLFSVLIWPITVFADDDALYDRAHRLLENKQYSEAQQIFSQLSDFGGNIQMGPAYQYFSAKAGYYAGYLEESLKDFGHVINRYPHSSFVPYAYFFSGNINCFLGKADLAVVDYTNAYKTSRDSKLDKITMQSLQGLAEKVPSAVIENMAVSSIPSKKRCDLLVPLCQFLMKGNSFQSIRSILSDCSSAEAERLISQADLLLKQQVEIGILVPLSGEMQRFGEAMLDGINLQLDKYRIETGRKITPVIYDTRGDEIEAARILRRLSASGVAAAIGPLTSDEASVSSAILACGDLPLIIPAASQSGLTELSSSCFQLLPNLAWQGRKMADFAVSQIGADTAAIFTPTTPENLRMARAFETRFKELGGTILCTEYFRTRETDFGPYVKDIKSQVIGQLLDSIIFINNDGDTIEAEEVPVWLDCIYIPAEANQLRSILPQIDFYNLNTTYLGGDGWGADLVYKLGDHITKECYFSSGRVESNTSEEAQLFMSDFDIKYGHQPGHLETVGYDAMSLISKALTNGQYSRADIKQYLSTVKDFTGASGKVTFGQKNENIELPVFKIENNLPIKIAY